MKNGVHSVLHASQLCDADQCGYPHDRCATNDYAILALRFTYLCTLYPGIVFLDHGSYGHRWLSRSRVNKLIATVRKLQTFGNPTSDVKEYLLTLSGTGLLQPVKAK